jgi:phage repressor protein C with HTH and peptisase S24 domain
MTTTNQKIIPIVADDFDPEYQSSCNDNEPFALMVLGDSMMPEFNEGEIIIIERGGRVQVNNYVMAKYNDEYIFRQLIQDASGWYLHALNESYPDVFIDDLSVVEGVITQKSVPGKRRETKIYIA